MDEEYVEAVLDLVERIPPGRVMSYGTVAEEVGALLGRGGPRTVARVMAVVGAAVPWWRVVTVSGRLPPGHEVRARRALAEEATPLKGDGVDMARAAWRP